MNNRNLPCYCGSNKKYKKCCLLKEEEQAKVQKAIDAKEWEEWFQKDLQEGAENLKSSEGFAPPVTP